MKKMISVFGAMLALASFGIDRNTEFQDVPADAKLGYVIDAGGGMQTNDVREIVRPMIADATNGVIVVVSNVEAKVETRRALTNNVCVVDSFSEWATSQPLPLGNYIGFNESIGGWAIYDGSFPMSPFKGDRDSTHLEWSNEETLFGRGVIADRTKPTTSNEFFVTESFVTDAAKDVVKIGQSQGIVSTSTVSGVQQTVFGVPQKYTKIDGRTLQLGAIETYVSHVLHALGTSYFQSADSMVFNDRNINLVELIESYIHANEGSGISVTDPSYSFANQARTATLSAPHIPTEDNPVVTPQGTLTYDGTNYWLNGETQYDRDVDGDVKASVTLDQQNLTNVVTAVKSYHYDETLGVTWKMVPDDGHIYLIAVTNANVVTQ